FSETGVSGIFTGSPCTLFQSSTGSASCTATFTAPASSGTASIMAAYTPTDTAHGSSQSSATSITIAQRATTTTIVCTTQVVVSQAAECTVVVVDSSTAGNPLTPTGAATFTETRVQGSFSSSSCTLVPV